MNNTIFVDTTTMMMVDMLREIEAQEPTAPDSDEMDQHAVAEASMLHYEWQGKRHATYVMLAARLVALAREQFIEGR